MLGIDLTGKRALIAGVADDGGFGWAIAKSLAEAGATVCVAAWPPAMGIFETMLARGKFDESRKLSDGSLLTFERIYPLDADFCKLEDAPAEIRENKRYKERGDFSIEGLAARFQADFGEDSLDILVHSLANGPEVKNPLLATSRRGYLGAVGASAYSFIGLIQKFGPLMRKGGSYQGLTYMASERVVPGYGGGMSSAKAALESDMRVLSFEVGRKWGHRVNLISAGPYASRAASAIGFIQKIIRYYTDNSPLPERLEAAEVGNTAAFLASPLASGITGTMIHVDKGFHSMAVPADLDSILVALDATAAASSAP